jgi:glyoxylase-like metal-dependent hydrolase (beta-lactamase superfamily II)
VSEPRVELTQEGERYVSPHALAYPELVVPQAGAGTRIAAGLHWLRVPLPMELNHINLWLLDDEPGWTLVDTGMAEDVCREAWAAIERATLRGRRIARIVITHDHPDHVGLAPWLAERHGAQVWMSASAHAAMQAYLEAEPVQIGERLRHFLRRHGLTAKAEGAMPAFDHRRWFGDVPQLARAVGGGETLRIGADDWQVIETAGHCGGHLCLHDPARGLLISGDQVLPSISSNVSVLPSRPEANPLAEYLESLALLAEACESGVLVLPSHGRPFRGLQSRCTDLRAHHQEQLAAVRAACAATPRSAFELLPVMFGRVLRGFHTIMALGEALAHLHWLRDAGAVHVEIGDDHTSRWRATRA